MKHSLFSQNEDMPIAWFDKFDKQTIKQVIIEHLEENPTDTLEHRKEFGKPDLRQYSGMEILNFYQMNNGKPCLVVTRKKEYYKPIEL